MMYVQNILLITLSLTTYVMGFSQQKKNDAKEIQKSVVNASNDNRFSADYIMGRFDPAFDPAFVIIPAEYRDEKIMYLRKDVLRAFISMYQAALKEGIRLEIKSATRNFEAQKRIWENKWTGATLLRGNVNAARDIADPVQRALTILEYSSMPGTSRHHWGTDIDINSFENEWFTTGEGLKLYEWMQKNAAGFGFCQPYTALGSDRSTGYFEEKWHWTYMPVSVHITKAAKKTLKDKMITGFMGAETARKIGVVEKYVRGISPACMNKE